MASPFVRVLKEHFDNRIVGGIANEILDIYVESIEFHTRDGSKVVIEKWEQPKLSFRVNISDLEYGKKNYLIDRILIKNMYNELLKEVSGI